MRLPFEVKPTHWIGIGASVLIVILDVSLFLGNNNLFLFLLGVAVVVLVLPFVWEIIAQNKREAKINEMFLEFSRNLAESVNTGTPISKSIINMRKKDYGPLSPYVIKLANQISIGIPVNTSLQTFAYEVNSPTIARAVALISEAERAGGDIDFILESSAKSIAEVDKLKKERKAAVSSLVVQGYIIFFIFIGVMLIMQFKILPLTNNIGSFNAFGGDFTSTIDQKANLPAQQLKPQDLANNFLYLLLTQAVFAGLIIGKLAEGSLKNGVKHSFILTTAAFLVSTGVRALLS